MTIGIHCHISVTQYCSGNGIIFVHVKGISLVLLWWQQVLSIAKQLDCYWGV